MAEVYSVSQVNSYIKSMFTANRILSHIYVKGEVSNCKYHPSGHLYFTLKDAGAQIACVMFAGQRAGISFRMEEGQNVIAFGYINVYERDGKFQLYAEEIRRDGIGRLYEEFAYLKDKLNQEGLFEQSHKKELPRYAKRVGIVTASSGAALQDIRQISARRNPYVQLILCPAKVQGEGAAETIVKGIRTLDGKVDVIIVGRGGGSIEDLWAFNEESVARAIYDCETPVISAVGHETDTTIADYVSDLRAPTPSAAAELAVYDLNALERELAGLHMEMADLFQTRIEKERMRVAYLEQKLKQYHPRNHYNQMRQYLMKLEDKLSFLMKQHVLDARSKTAVYAGRLKGLSPMERLSAGYAFVTKDDVVVKSITQVAIGDIIHADLADGTMIATVQQAERRKEGEA